MIIYLLYIVKCYKVIWTKSLLCLCMRCGDRLCKWTYLILLYCWSVGQNCGTNKLNFWSKHFYHYLYLIVNNCSLLFLIWEYTLFIIIQNSIYWLIFNKNIIFEFAISYYALATSSFLYCSNIWNLHLLIVFISKNQHLKD